MNGGYCVVLRTHYVDDEIYGNLIEPLVDTLDERYTLVIAHDATHHPWPRRRYPVQDILPTDESIMQTVNGNGLHRNNWYNLDSSLARVHRERPGFEHYWFIEYDVRFSGNWADFFQRCENHQEDLLLIEGLWPFNGDYDWWVWHELQWDSPVPVEQRYAGYSFVARFSGGFLACVDRYTGRRTGFGEVYIPTLAVREGFTSAAVDPDLRGSVCATNAAITPQEYADLGRREPDRLFHKVKPCQ